MATGRTESRAKLYQQLSHYGPLFIVDRNQSEKGVVKELDKQMREHTYTDAVWANQTGKTLDELWKDYATNPAI